MPAATNTSAILGPMPSIFFRSSPLAAFLGAALGFSSAAGAASLTGVVSLAGAASSFAGAASFFAEVAFLAGAVSLAGAAFFTFFAALGAASSGAAISGNTVTNVLL